jgi:release factor glutamine methyltransferase
VVARVAAVQASLAQSHRSTSNSISDSLLRGAQRLRSRTASARLEAEVLLGLVLGRKRSYLYAHREETLTDDQLDEYQSLLERRLRGEPLPYLTRRIEFCGLEFTVDPHVLIPRPETETLVDLALQLGRKRALGGRERLILDVGTGSGCIAVALAVNDSHARIYATDLSAGALKVARANAHRHRVQHRIRFIQGDLATPVREHFDLIVANPPYIASNEWATLPIEVREHEPRIALDGGVQGVDIVQRLLGEVSGVLRPDGAVLIEFGARQGPAVTQMARTAFPGAVISVHSDLSGNDRVLSVQQPCGSK